MPRDGEKNQHEENDYEGIAHRNLLKGKVLGLSLSSLLRAFLAQPQIVGHTGHTA